MRNLKKVLTDPSTALGVTILLCHFEHSEKSVKNQSPVQGIAASAIRRPPRNYTRRSAFTLVELLVIIAIILSITALTFPALQLARNHTKAVVCGANIGRLCSAMAAYESMSNSFPYGFNLRKDTPPGGFPGNQSYDRRGWWWLNYIDVYTGDAVGKPSIVKCPAKRLTVRWMQLDILCGNYGANLSICKDGLGANPETEFKGMPLVPKRCKRPEQDDAFG